MLALVNYSYYNAQEATIENFSPTIIPVSGSIVISITGNNLDISNASLTRILVVDVPCIQPR